jgi:hypothetical protein
MDKRARLLLLLVLSLSFLQKLSAAEARFDLIGPKIDVRVTRDGITLPIASVPNLQPGDKLWIHPDLPASQSVHYLLICVFLRGTTNPPPDEWFTRIETWNHKVREEGTFVTVPAEAQQAILFMAPETGGDFTTLKSAVRGRPGAFVRASQDLIEAGFEEARIEKYIASIRRVPASDSAELQKHSDLLARTLSLKPNADCFKRPIDMQFTCLTQSGSQIVLDDGHGMTVVDALNGPTSDLINQASYTKTGGGGLYSAYVGAIVDVVRITSNLHTAQYQYIPAISFPQDESLNLRLNTPPSFHNPKSVLVIALPAVQAAVPPPLRPADANNVACLIQPSVVLPIEGAPLVFSAAFAHDLVLHLNTPPGAPAEQDIPLTADAYSGGLVLHQVQTHHIPLHSPTPLPLAPADLITHRPTATPEPAKPEPKPQPEPILLTGVIQGRWGFDAYTGPTVQLQQLPGTGWHIVEPAADGLASNESARPSDLIAGHDAQLLLASTGTACVHTITAQPANESGPQAKPITIPFKTQPRPDQTNLIAVTLPLQHDVTPGDLHLLIQQYDQPKPDEISARTFSEPATIRSVELHAADKTLLVTGTRLAQIEKLTLGDLVFTPAPQSSDEKPTDPNAISTLHLSLPSSAPAPPTHNDQHLTAQITLHDGRQLSAPLTVSSARPVISLLSKTETPVPTILLTNPDDLPLSSTLTFTLKTPTAFPRNGELEIETLDGTLRSVLTLAPSGGLLLQDPHTVVATLDPQRSFGPSAFGALHMRAIYPPSTHSKNVSYRSDTPASSNPSNLSSRPELERSGDAAERPAAPAATDSPDDTNYPASDWLPLATLVRLPTLTLLQCPTDPTQPCTLTGSSLYLLSALSTDPTFANPVPVPDGYTGTTLTIPHPAAATLFLKLRDDPNPIDSAILPTPPPPAAPAHTHKPHPTTPTPDTPAAKQESPTPVAPSSPTTPNK